MNTDYWYQGVLQIEGCKKDIILFLTKGIEAIDANGKNVCTSYPSINKKGDIIDVIFNLKNKAVNFKIKDIDKNIILAKKCNVYDWHDDNDIIIIGLGIRFERLFFEDFLKTVFDKYKISFKLYKYGRENIYKTDFKNFLYTQCENREEESVMPKMNKEIEELNSAIRILRNFCKNKEEKGLDCCGDGDDFYECPFVLMCPVFNDDAPCDWTDIKDEEE